MVHIINGEGVMHAALYGQFIIMLNGFILHASNRYIGNSDRILNVVHHFELWFTYAICSAIQLHICEYMQWLWHII